MIFEFDSDQRLWQETVRDIVAKRCPPAVVRAVVDDGTDPAPVWQAYVEHGWTELAEPASAVELAIVLEELGRANDPTPYLATMSQFAPLVTEFARPGETGAAVYEGVRARREGTEWRLDGIARRVLDGDRAERLAVVTAAGVFVVPAAAVTVARTEIFDPVVHMAEVRFENVRVGDADRGPVPAPAARPPALTGMALTVVGACQRILDAVLEHVRTREQFGVPIGAFQAVKHKAADMHVAIERARALAYYAALTIAEAHSGREIAAAMAKAAAGECQSLVFRNGVQLFGAMGFTWENDVQFALKRAKFGELLLGGAAVHRALIAEEYRATHL
ncbi:acyl-CoA dehydrogenase family protein [Nocardia sp. NPDC050712]|uniref:acyl-CoA dehydrogenase family protein n=1 Tax=Nocardia sp. NPDC050712 TaxID=3155518 RepID=UPI00340F50B0